MQLGMKVLSNNFKVCTPWEEDMKVKFILTHVSRAHRAQTMGVTHWCVLKHKERLTASELVYAPLGTSRDLLRVCADGFMGTSFRPSMSKLTVLQKSHCLRECVGRGCSVLLGLHSQFLLHNHPSFNLHKSYLSPNCNLTMDHQNKRWSELWMSGKPPWSRHHKSRAGLCAFPGIKCISIQGKLDIRKKKKKGVLTGDEMLWIPIHIDVVNSHLA